jgi:hypothetical protein
VAKRHGISATRVKRIWAETDHESGPIVPYTTEQDDGNERRSGPFAVTTGRTKHAKMASSSSSTSYSASDGVDPDVAAALEQLDVSLAAIDAQGGTNLADESMVAEARDLNDALAHAQVIDARTHTRNAKQLRTKSSKHGHRQLQEAAPPPRQHPVGRKHAAPPREYPQRRELPARLREGDDYGRSGGRSDSPRGGSRGPGRSCYECGGRGCSWCDRERGGAGYHPLDLGQGLPDRRYDGGPARGYDQPARADDGYGAGTPQPEPQAVASEPQVVAVRRRRR